MHPIAALVTAGATAPLAALVLSRAVVVLAAKQSEPELVRPAPWPVTLLATVGTGLAALGVGAGPLLPAYLVLALAGTALIVVDLAQHRLPDRVVYPTYAAGLVLLALDADAHAYVRGLVAMAALFAGFLLLALITPSALGLGDVKLAGLLGLYLGHLGAGVLAIGFLSGVALGALAGLALLLSRRAAWRTEFAYGPALLAGALLAVGVGQPLWNAYTGAAGI
jgi:leader peptidase (prepilin peptidase) / N-methyltransferase